MTIPYQTLNAQLVRQALGRIVQEAGPETAKAVHTMIALNILNELLAALLNELPADQQDAKELFSGAAAEASATIMAVATMGIDGDFKAKTHNVRELTKMVEGIVDTALRQAQH